MKLTVAGTTKEYDTGLTVEKLLEVENVESPLYVTVSLNNEFLSQDLFATTVLKDGDTVEFFYFMGGGR
ncbi:MAG: sulfur carrier protein ThiS [Faecalibacterium sp.]